MGEYSVMYCGDQKGFAIFKDGVSMDTEDKIQWWAYRHTNGEVKLKRYFEQRDIDEANESVFVDLTYGPFEADSRDAALEILKLADMAFG